MLTGFKYIGEQIGLLEKAGEAERYIFGFEESYGYLSGSFVRDKDAVNASLLICEMFAWYKAKGMTLADALRELYAKYGYFESKLLSYSFEGVSGFRKMNALMDSLRGNTPESIAGFRLISTLDYENEGTGLPKSNVIRLTAEEAEAVVRPSGTEPKLKIYLTAKGGSADECRRKVALLEDFFEEWVH